MLKCQQKTGPTVNWKLLCLAGATAALMLYLRFPDIFEQTINTG